MTHICPFSGTNSGHWPTHQTLRWYCDRHSQLLDIPKPSESRNLYDQNTQLKQTSYGMLMIVNARNYTFERLTEQSQRHIVARSTRIHMIVDHAKSWDEQRQGRRPWRLDLLYIYISISLFSFLLFIRGATAVRTNDKRFFPSSS